MTTESTVPAPLPPGLPATFGAARPLLVGRALTGVGHSLRAREVRLQGADGLVRRSRDLGGPGRRDTPGVYPGRRDVP